MTPTRKLALKISHFVVRYASPGSKEWAEGLAREVAFIENDWSALAWALGSTKVLLDYREAPIASLADVPNAARKFVEEMRSGTPSEWIVILQCPLFVWKFFNTKPGCPEHAGCVLAVLSSILLGIFLLMERRRLKDPANDSIYDDVVVCARFYRAELERRRSTVWISLAAVFGWIVGGVFHAVFSPESILLFLAMTPRYFVVPQRLNRRRIEQLDALLAERS